ncbi:MAG: hypothetical protein U1F68_12605 [Gammaproteobacteria bacterium]
MKTLMLVSCALAISLVTSAQACDKMNQMTMMLKTYSDKQTKAEPPAAPVDAEKKLVVDTKKPETSTAN